MHTKKWRKIQLIKYTFIQKGIHFLEKCWCDPLTERIYQESSKQVKTSNSCHCRLPWMQLYPLAYANDYRFNLIKKFVLRQQHKYRDAFINSCRRMFCISKFSIWSTFYHRKIIGKISWAEWEWINIRFTLADCDRTTKKETFNLNVFRTFFQWNEGVMVWEYHTFALFFRYIRKVMQWKITVFHMNENLLSVSVRDNHQSSDI